MEHQYDMEYHNTRMATEQERCRPSVLFQPHLFLENRTWYAVYGKPPINSLDFLAGIFYATGSSPEEAMANFDSGWKRKVCW